jgi:uncharacterized membrane protein (UPF0127 family)
MSRWFSLSLLGVTLAISGCDRPANVAVAALGDPTDPTGAQPKLQTIKLYVGSEEVIAEVASTPRQQQVGMMYRTNLAENAGMLFPLPFTQRAMFWMKHCPCPLSAAYIDPEGIIREIHDLEPYNTNTVAAASDNIRFVLETPRGWFQRHHVAEGVSVATESGTLMHTFFDRLRR